MLAMTAHGFDTCPMEGMDGKRVKQLLDLPSGAEICMVISCGKRAPEGVYGPGCGLSRSCSLKKFKG